MTEDTPLTDEDLEDGREQIEPESMIDKANKAVRAMKVENDRAEALIKRQEALQAQRMLGGKSEAGSVPEKPREETPEEYIRRVERGETNVAKKQ